MNRDQRSDLNSVLFMFPKEKHEVYMRVFQGQNVNMLRVICATKSVFKHMQDSNSLPAPAEAAEAGDNMASPHEHSNTQKIPVSTENTEQIKGVYVAQAMKSAPVYLKQNITSKYVLQLFRAKCSEANRAVCPPVIPTQNKSDCI